MLGLAFAQLERVESLTQRVLKVAAELDVRTAAGHVGRDRDRALFASLGDDVGLALVLLGVEHLVLNAALVEQLGQAFGVLDRRRADKNRLADLVDRFDLVADRRPLFGLGAIHGVGRVVARDRQVRRNLDHVEAVDLVELAGLGDRRSGHARELVVQQEVVLEGDRRHRLVFLADLQAFFDLHCLVQTIRPTAPGHLATGELVDDRDLHPALALFDHVVIVERIQVVGAQRVLDVVRPVHVAGRVERIHADQLLGGFDAVLEQVDLALLLFDFEVLFGLELERNIVGDLVLLRHLFRRATDDQRRARLVDQDRVDLVDDRVVQDLLHLVLHAVLHVVAQVVKAELVVRAVDDVAVVHGRALGGRHVRLDPRARDAEIVKDRHHPQRVTLGEVIVDRHEEARLPRERVEVQGQRRHQRLAFTRRHLCDVTLVQRDATDELHIKVAQAQRAQRRFARDRKRLGQQLVEGHLAFEDRRAPPGGVRLYVLHRKPLGPRFVSVDRLDHRLQRTHHASVAVAEHAAHALADGLAKDAEAIR